MNIIQPAMITAMTTPTITGIELEPDEDESDDAGFGLGG